MFHLLCTVGTKPGFTLEASPVLRDTFYDLHYPTFFFGFLELMIECKLNSAAQCRTSIIYAAYT